jgi:Zinc-finger
VDKKKRTEVICRVGDLLDDRCKSCPLNDPTSAILSPHCQEKCEVGAELKKLGYLLGREKPKKPLTVARYKKMRQKGLTDKQIQAEERIGHKTLAAFKREHGLVQEKGVKVK